jgi:hypothetical protein
LNCSRAHRRCRKICETGNIEPMKSPGLNMDQPEKRLRGIQLRKFTELPECQIRRCNYRFYICVALLKFTSRAHRKFFLRPRGALHMYMALKAVKFAPPECPVAVQFSLCFYFLCKTLKNSFCFNGGTEKFENTSRLLV